MASPTTLPADWRSQPHLIERPAVVPMSFDDFIAWDHEGGLAEWVDGEVHLYVSNSSNHQRILQFLIELLGVYTRVTHAGRLRTAPYAMRLPRRGREPDITFVLAGNAARMGEKYLDGPADLVVEIVSEDDPVRDRVVKFQEYEAAGVGEYWIIDSRPGREQADFYVHDGTRFVAAPNDGGVFRSAVLPEFWLRTAWLWDEDADPLRCASEVLGRDRLAALLG
jgi:Uma2 family endonuclease